MQKVASTSAPAKIEFLKTATPAGPYQIVHSIMVQNVGAETIFLTVNSDTVDLDNGIELYPTEKLRVAGHGGESFTHMHHRTETSSGILKWMKLS